MYVLLRESDADHTVKVVALSDTMDTLREHPSVWFRRSAWMAQSTDRGTDWVANGPNPDVSYRITEREVI
jgi:hypothetical protein